MPAGWEETVREGASERVLQVNDMAMRDGVLVAIGEAIHTTMLHIGPYIIDSRIWVSRDAGESWEEVSTGQFPNAGLKEVVAGDDGFYLFGYLEAVEADDPYENFSVWHSPDGRTWTKTTLGPFHAMDFQLTDIEVGPRGWLAIGSLTDFSDGFYSENQIWHSPDGRIWTKTRSAGTTDPYTGEEGYRDVGAGPEGFVVLGAINEVGGGDAMMLASADGRTWQVASTPSDMTTVGAGVDHVAPIGGDWVIAGSYGAIETGFTPVPVWWSSNGMDWKLSAELAHPDRPAGYGWSRELTSSGDRLFLSTGIGGFAEQLEAGVWTSTDGRSWSLLPIDQAAHVAAAMRVDDRFILVGHIATRESDATIWVGRPD